MENQSVYEKLIEALAGNPAIAFGHQVIAEMATENILLGITQAGKTSSVRKASAEVISALSTGSLYDAIAEIRTIPAESKDAVFFFD